MQAGIEFFVSKNNVVLSSGIDGVISPNYFKIVKDLKGLVLFENKEL
jgi:2'-phosphotransferase